MANEVTIGQLHQDRFRYLGLGATGSLVWARLAQPGTVPEGIEYVAAACAPLPECAAGEIAGFVEELRREGPVQTARPTAPADAVGPARESIAHRDWSGAVCARRFRAAPAGLTGSSSPEGCRNEGPG